MTNTILKSLFIFVQICWQSKQGQILHQHGQDPGGQRNPTKRVLRKEKTGRGRDRSTTRRGCISSRLSFTWRKTIECSGKMYQKMYQNTYFWIFFLCLFSSSVLFKIGLITLCMNKIISGRHLKVISVDPSTPPTPSTSPI